MTNQEPTTFKAPGLEAERASLLSDLTRPLDDVEGTDLDSLRDELTAELDTEFDLEVPARPGYAVRCSRHFDHELLKAWRKRAGAGAKGRKAGQVDELRFACIVVASQTRAIVRNGNPLTAGAEEVTFASAALQELYGVSSAVEAVRALYGYDGHVLAAGNAVLEEAGYGDRLEVDDEDPTAAG